MKVEIISPVTPAQIDELISDMRPECIADLKALGWDSPRQVMDACLKKDASTTAIVIGGKVAMVCGVYGEGQVWIWATNVVKQHPVEFLESSKEAARKAMGDRPCLTNYVHAAFKSSVNWLRWLGAEIGPPEPRGPAGDLFHRATLTREALHVR